MFKKIKQFQNSYVWKSLIFIVFFIVGIRCIFYPESIHIWFIQGMGILWLIDAMIELLEIIHKYLKNKITELENDFEK